MHLMRVSCSVALALTLFSCNKQPGPKLPGTDGGPNPAVTGCPVTLTHRPTATANTVEVIGEWNGFERPAQALTDDGHGTWSGTLWVPPGKWAYSFLDNGAEVTGSDADATYIRYVDGKPMGALRVADCSAPSLTVEPSSLTNTRPSAGAGHFEITLTVTPGTASSGAIAVGGSLRLPSDETTGAPRTLTTAELVPGEGSVHVTLNNLVDGKYTLKLWATAGDKTSPSVLLPFWVEAEHFNFRDSPLYMAMTDRFRDGDPSNNVPPGIADRPASFQGGDFQGVEQSIRDGYFDNLNIKELWLSPWQTQTDRVYLENGHNFSSYHGYFPVKAREVDPRFGGADALHKLVAEAHRHGIRIVMDAVVNHVHSDHEYFQDPTKKAWFRTGCICGSSPECGFDTARLTCLFRDYMPDINWTNNDAADQFSDDIVWWVEQFDLDGLRLDAVKQVEDAAVIDLAGKIRERFTKAGTEYYMFGETFTGDTVLINHYIGPNALDAQLNFPLFFNTPEPVFARDDQGLQAARDNTQGSLATFAGAPMVNFLGNHDVSRFITKADPANRDLQNNAWGSVPGAPSGQTPYDRLYLAMANLMTTPGVPFVYYGDEYGEFGGADPDNRHMLNREPALWAEQRNQLGKMQRLLKARAALRGLRRGPLVDLWCNNDQWGQGKGNLYAYARTDPDPKQSAVVVLNLTYNTWTNVVLTFPAQLGWSGGTLREELSQSVYPFLSSTVPVDVPAHGAVVLHLQ